MLEMLKIDLGIDTSETIYDTRLNQYLTSAQAEIVREGYTFPDTLTLSDQQVIVMYAAWLWRRRDDMSGMPRMLRYRLNQLVLSQVMQESED